MFYPIKSAIFFIFYIFLHVCVCSCFVIELPSIDGYFDDANMELMTFQHSRPTIQISPPLHPPPTGSKPNKKEVKLMQQRLEKLARINIHLRGRVFLFIYFFRLII